MLNEMGASQIITLFAATAILAVGVVDDLRSRKFHNWLFLGCTGFALIVALATGGVSGFPIALIGFAAGFAILMPLVLLGIIGAGDMKLMAAFGLVAGWSSVLTVTIHAFIWGAAFGVLRAVFNGQGKVLAGNMYSLVLLRDRQKLVLQSMPFTIALLMGWLSHLVVRGVI